MIFRRLCLAALIPVLGLAACNDQPEGPVEQKPAAETASIVNSAEPVVDAEETLPSAEPEKAFSLVALDPAGLLRIGSIKGTTEPIAFGASREQVEALLTEIRGKQPTRGANEECGAGPMQFSTYGDFTANFQEGRFIGWFVGEQEEQLKTTESIGIGSSAAALKAAMPIAMQEDSTIGIEFFSERSEGKFIGGLLSSAADDATVIALYAGINCFFR